MSDLYEYGTDVTELVRRYRALYSGAIYDVLDGLGLPNQALATDIKPIRQDMVIAGPAFTVKGIPDTAGDPDLRDRRIHLFNDMRATGVPLIDVRDCSFDTQVAHYGEMNATVGASCGVVGAVVDGGSRDTRFLLDRDFPVMARYLTPVEAYMRWSYYEWQQQIALRGALSSVVAVHPGDFIMGDLDGAVVIPRELVVEVVVKTEELITTENSARRDFESGMDPVEVYKKYGRL
ncbi:RraA family protein [Plantibacter sp. YIM 135347]|uniref:RraA family protein n=1 Tax=Plantibacter sp. YIM 135347 TaxID=3423919 RepID=UPI003D32F598